MPAADQLVGFATDHLLLTSTLAGLTLVAVLERKLVLGWLCERLRISSVGGLPSRLSGLPSVSLPSPGVGVAGGVRRALSALWLVPRRLGATVLRAAPSAFGDAWGVLVGVLPISGRFRTVFALLLFLAAGLVVAWLLTALPPL